MWPDLVDPWRVFQFCKWTLNVGFGVAFWSGIPATEIHSVCRMLSVEVDDQLLSDIRVMEASASKVLNKRKND